MVEEFPELLAALREQAGPAPFDLAVVLGSGFGSATAATEPLADLPYALDPAFPRAGVAGHAGRLLAGCLGPWRVLFFVGRCHLYEGLDARRVSSSVRLAHAAGCRRLLLTNAAGGIAAEAQPGDFLFVTDHINLLGDNPLRGESRNPFIDLCGLYQQGLYPALAAFAETLGIRLHRGVLAACTGPSFETPAEIRALRTLGADAVSMSSIPEAIMGRYLGLKVICLSLIANRAAGLGCAPLDHEEVLEAGRHASRDFIPLLQELVRLWAASEALPVP